MRTSARSSPSSQKIFEEIQLTLPDGIALMLQVVDTHLKDHPHDTTIKFLRRLLLKQKYDLEKLIAKKPEGLSPKKEKNLVMKIIETFSIHLLCTMTVHKMEGIDMQELWNSTRGTLSGFGFHQMLNDLVKSMAQLIKER